MAFPIIPKLNSAPGAGAPATLTLGELAANRSTAKLYMGTDSGVQEIAFAGVLGGTVISSFTAAGGTSFSPINGYTSTDVSAYFVSVAGIEQRPTVDWTISSAAGGTVVFATAPPSGATIIVRAVVAGSGGGGGGTDIGGRAWSSTATYTEGDLVATDQTSTWICIQAANTNHDPVTSPDWWAPAPASAVQLQFRPIAATAPTAGQVLGWNATNSQWEPMTIGNAGGTITFDAVGVYDWVAPMFARYVRVQGYAGDGTGGTGGQGTDGADGFNGPWDEFPQTGASGTDVIGTAGESGKSILFNDLTFNGGAGGAAGGTGYGGGGGGSRLTYGNDPDYFYLGLDGNGPESGKGSGAAGCSEAGSTGGWVGGIGFNGGGDGGSCYPGAVGQGGGGGCNGSGGGGAQAVQYGPDFYPGAGGKGGKGADTTGEPGTIFDQYTLVTGGELYEVEITEGAGSASITISW